MSVRVLVKNFQSIREADVEIAGFTVVTGANNTGKALQHGTLVATPRGWRRVEDLIMGDMVLAGDGSPTAILGVYPQGERPVWRVRFDDGRHLDVDADHLWQVSIGSKRFHRGLGQQWELSKGLDPNPRVGPSQPSQWPDRPCTSPYLPHWTHTFLEFCWGTVVFNRPAFDSPQRTPNWSSSSGEFSLKQCIFVRWVGVTMGSGLVGAIPILSSRLFDRWT